MGKQINQEKIIVQTCTSKECKKMFKKQITNLCEAITTPHTYNSKTKKLTCQYCGKISKIGT